jgi:outer membrane lipoprotein SlyB
MKRISMLTALSLSLAAVSLSACSSTAQPIVDTKGVNSTQYNQDNYECQQYAQQVSPVGDAITGALVGGVSAGEGAAFGAATGGALGLGGGAVTGVQNQRQVYRNCMSGRGYSVLN